MILLFTLATLLISDPDPAEIIRKAVDAAERNAKIARNYTYTERDEDREMKADGSLKKSESETFDVLQMHGSMYTRLIQKNDKPLPPKDERKEQEKMDKFAREREEESPEKRRKRRAKEEEERAEERKFMREITDAYTFTVLPDVTIDGRATWVIDCVPKPGFKPTLKNANILPKVKGRLWVDQREYHFVKAEIEVIDTLSFGLSLVRIHKGTNMVFEDTRVNDEVWLPKRFFVRGSARLAYFKVINGEEEDVYRDYKKFQVESKVIATSDVPPQ
jgi:hypothetical protein